MRINDWISVVCSSVLIFVVLKMIGAIGDQVRAHRGAGQPLAEEIVEYSVRMQRAVSRVVHQDREPELAAAEKDDREQPRGRILRPGRKTDECEADDPGVCDEPDTAPRRGARQRRPLGAVEEAVDRKSTRLNSSH